jgi:hypothetical protein
VAPTGAQDNRLLDVLLYCVKLFGRVRLFRLHQLYMMEFGNSDTLVLQSYLRNMKKIWHSQLLVVLCIFRANSGVERTSWSIIIAKL